MPIVDWRELTTDRVTALYLQQARVWAESLGWDLAPSWAAIERARAAGALPGLVWLSARGTIDGWTFFVRQADVVQIGALMGAGARPVRDLLEAILSAPEAAGARELTCLLYPAGPNALSALTRRRFVIQPLRYFSRTASTVTPGVPAVLPAELAARRWRDEDAVSAVRVLARAYGREHRGRSLAPHGTLDEWAHYLRQVLRTPACGTMLPRASFLVEERATGTAAGFILMTQIGPKTAHVAQLVTDPQWTRRGVGRVLLRMSAKAAAVDSFERVTLLVGQDNEGALRLYEGEGFLETTRFTFASRLMPVRRRASVAA